jgi:multidrug efflux pump subunit AcrA (membrane-fusion protein)
MIEQTSGIEETIEQAKGAEATNGTGQATLDYKESAEGKHSSKSPRRLITLLLLGGAVAALTFVIVSGIRTRVQASTALIKTTDQAAVLTVSVVHPQTGAPSNELVLPGNAQAFTDTPIYSRTSGYLRKWYFDIGARVKQGELLAEIDTPEIDRQVQQGRADLQTAQANFNLAQTTATRWEFLLKTNSVSKQETDQAESNVRATQAIVDSNTANVHRLEELQSFEKVYAPFDGVITARNTDVGALITAGASPGTGSGTTINAAPGGNPAARELFHVAALHTIRVFVAVPEVYAGSAVNGGTVILTADANPGRTFRGMLVRNSNAIDPASRTLLVEVDVANSDGQLLPGAYASVHLKVAGQAHSLTVPANTLLFRTEGLRVGVVRNGQAQLIPIHIGRDYGARVEVVSGLAPTDEVILDPVDSLISGAPVTVSGLPTVTGRPTVAAGK